MLGSDGDVIPVSTEHSRYLMPLALAFPEHTRETKHVVVVCFKHRVSLGLKGLRCGARLAERENFLQAGGLLMTGANQHVSGVSGFEDDTVFEAGANA